VPRSGPLLTLWIVLMVGLQGALRLTGYRTATLAAAVERGAVRMQRDTFPLWTTLALAGRAMAAATLLSVTERTREIGLRMVVGARRRGILLRFPHRGRGPEPAGGHHGHRSGLQLCTFVSLYPRLADIAVPWWTSALGFCISASTGIVFGLLPALKAALLNPIDAGVNK
jgi:hypothetical protein